MLESVVSWLSPTALFLLLNLVIGTIAFISYRSSSSSSADPSAAGGAHLFSASRLPRSPSILLDRLKSCNLLLSSSSSSSSSSSDPADSNETIQNTVQIPKSDQCEPEPEPKPVTNPEPRPGQGKRVGRSQSDVQPAAGEMPKKLAKKLKKSATLKSAFIHFDFEGPAEEESPPPKRPATMRERQQEKEEAEVDENADDFINRFRQQLKLQRLDSIIRYKEMLGRGN